MHLHPSLGIKICSFLSYSLTSARTKSSYRTGAKRFFRILIRIFSGGSVVHRNPKSDSPEIRRTPGPVRPRSGLEVALITSRHRVVGRAAHWRHCRHHRRHRHRRRSLESRRRRVEPKRLRREQASSRRRRKHFRFPVDPISAIFGTFRNPETKKKKMFTGKRFGPEIRELFLSTLILIRVQK